jgi:hypothetical protein
MRDLRVGESKDVCVEKSWISVDAGEDRRRGVAALKSSLQGSVELQHGTARAGAGFIGAFPPMDGGHADAQQPRHGLFAETELAADEGQRCREEHVSQE